MLRAAEAAGAAPISIQLARATALTDSKKFTEAVTILQRVLATPEALEQRQGEVMVSLAEAYQAQGDLLRAANTLEEAEALEAPPPRLVARRAALAQAQGSFGAALTLWGKAVKDEDAIGEDFVNLGRVAYKLRRPKAALRPMLKLAETSPRTPDLLYYIGQLQLQKGRSTGQRSRLSGPSSTPPTTKPGWPWAKRNCGADVPKPQRSTCLPPPPAPRHRGCWQRLTWTRDARGNAWRRPSGPWPLTADGDPAGIIKPWF